ncbi:MAG: glutamyl-tRNA reductase [Rhodospirillales bacterium]|nr:glutamyl-tRNA reductase [Rhodospirillales bacterium]
MATNKPKALRPFVVGLSHRSSTLGLRDQLFLEESQIPAVLGRLRLAGVGHALVLSTCDRIEVQGMDDDPETAAARAIAAVAQHTGVEDAALAGQTYTLTDADAVRQMFRVAASLDSLIIGEPQVLGQVKAGHRMAADAGMTGGGLEALIQAAYGAAKRVRSETAIGERPVSIAAAAARLAHDLHGDLGRVSGLLVGTGEMGELVAAQLLGEGLGHLTVVHPNEGRAEALARTLNCNVGDFDELERLLDEADVLLTALGSRRQVIDADMMLVVLHRRRKRPVFLIDTSLPGDVEPAVNRLDEVFLYDLGDLERVAMEGRATREQEAAGALAIVDEEVESFLRGRDERAAVPALNELRGHFENVRSEVLAEAGDDAERATRLLVNRLLHAPSEAMRRAAAEETDWPRWEALIRRLFGLSRGGKGSDR